MKRFALALLVAIGLVAGFPAITSACGQYSTPLGSVAAIQESKQHIAPLVKPEYYQPLSAIVTVETGGWPWTIHDNTDGCPYYFPSVDMAIDEALTLYNDGHTNLDLGLAQINSSNLRGLAAVIPGLPSVTVSVPAAVTAIFDPDRNIAAGEHILDGCWQRVKAAFTAGEILENPFAASASTVGCYNTNSIYKGKDYVKKVVAAAQHLPPAPAYVVQRTSSQRLSVPMRAQARTASAVLLHGPPFKEGHP